MCQITSQINLFDGGDVLWDYSYMETKKRTRGWQKFNIGSKKSMTSRSCRHCRQEIVYFNKSYKGCCTAKCYGEAGDEIITNTNCVTPTRHAVKKSLYNDGQVPSTIFDAVHERKYRG